MSDELQVDVRYKTEVTHAAIPVAELELLDSILPELLLLAQRFDDSDAD